MAKTSDVIIPREFERYAIEWTAELSRFGDSGIVEHDPAFDEIAMQGGREVKMDGMDWMDWIKRVHDFGFCFSAAQMRERMYVSKVGRDRAFVAPPKNNSTTGGSARAINRQPRWGPRWGFEEGHRKEARQKVGRCHEYRFGGAARNRWKRLAEAAGGCGTPMNRGVNERGECGQRRLQI